MQEEKRLAEAKEKEKRLQAEREARIAAEKEAARRAAEEAKAEQVRLDISSRIVFCYVNSR